MRTFLEPVYKKLRVPFFPNFSDVLDRADLLVADNTSALYEFASTGRPVLVLNAPWYRRNIHHGLRFWDAIPGLEVNHPEELPVAIRMAISDSPALKKVREKAVATAYNGVSLDGRATERAVKALMELMDG